MAKSQIGGNMVGIVADTEADARAKMLIYLVENGLADTAVKKGV